MDRVPEELQFMGFYGIYKESYKFIFSQITLALILPFTFIFLAQIQLSEFIFFELYDNENILYGFHSKSPTHNRIGWSISSEWIIFWLFKSMHFIFILILSLVSTSAVVYTIACIYTSKLQTITFTQVMTVVPKVWKRLMVTSLQNFVILFVYNALAILLIALVAVLFTVLIPQQVLLIVILFILLICYLIGFFCISVIWQLASVVSVLEDMYGIKTMIKSKDLIKSNRWVASFTYLSIQICLSVIQRMFMKLVVVVVDNDGITEGGGLGIESRVGYGLLCFVLFWFFIHIGLVTQTVIYFVCKSYHHENIDKSCLADHLETVYIGEYVPTIKNKYVQLESSDV